MKILIAICAILAGWLLTVKQALGFGDEDVNTATFTALNIVPGYKDPGTRQWGARLAGNTAYNYRHSDQNMVIEGQAFANVDSDGVVFTFDSARDYSNSGTYIEINFRLYYRALTFSSSVPMSLTTEYFTRMLVHLTTTYQRVLTDVDIFSDPYGVLASVDMRSLNTGGIEIKITTSGGTSDVYLYGTITELRSIA